MNTTTTNPSNPEQIRSEIDQTRERMDGNIDALTERLKGKHILDEVLGFFRTPDGQNKATEITRKISQSTEQAMRSAAESIKANPIPLLLIGAGIGWAVYAHTKKSRESAQYSSGYEKLPMGEYPSATSGLDISGKVTHALETSKDATSAAVARGRELAEQGKVQVTRAVEEHPLSVGLACLAAGVVAGILIPTPAPAARLMQAPAARLREEAERVGQDLVQKGQEIAHTATEALQTSLSGSAEASSHRTGNG